MTALSFSDIKSGYGRVVMALSLFPVLSLADYLGRVKKGSSEERLRLTTTLELIAQVTAAVHGLHTVSRSAVRPYRLLNVSAVSLGSTTLNNGGTLQHIRLLAYQT